MTTDRKLLLIADIGGYTELMRTHRMSLAHVEVNTARLLERVIDAAPDFELIEIEGDAAFLCRSLAGVSDAEAVASMLTVASEMHRAFHLERQYVAANLCPCKGCAQTDNLTLKFVAHVGDVATQTIRERHKLVGIDVILIHRMVKNSVGIPEYVLLSEELHGGGQEALPVPGREVVRDIEGFGTTRAFFVDVADVAGAIPPAPAVPVLSRVGQTLALAGAGLPSMLGLRRRRRVAAPAQGT